MFVEEKSDDHMQLRGRVGLGEQHVEQAHTQQPGSHAYLLIYTLINNSFIRYTFINLEHY